jgi:DNA mismatch endonuclease, patch repair protein
VDVLSPRQRSFNMSRIRGRDTTPELVIRRALHALGFRFRLQDRKLPGRPDLVLPKYHAVIFVHGCFWHGHGCHLFKWPATRREFWKDKIARNRARDDAALTRLEAEGWRALTIWECALKGTCRLPVTDVIQACTEFLRNSDIASDTIRGPRSVDSHAPGSHRASPAKS